MSQSRGSRNLQIFLFHWVLFGPSVKKLIHLSEERKSRFILRRILETFNVYDKPMKGLWEKQGPLWVFLFQLPSFSTSRIRLTQKQRRNILFQLLNSVSI